MIVFGAIRSRAIFTNCCGALVILLTLSVVSNAQLISDGTLTSHSDREVCNLALGPETPTWREHETRNKYVMEALSRRLSEWNCARLLERFSPKLEGINDREICTNALHREMPRWTSKSGSSHWVWAARLRSLTETKCANLLGRASQEQVAALNSDLESSLVCQKAIQNHSPQWEQDGKWTKYVSKAQRRGFTEQQCARLTNRFTEAELSAVHAVSESGPLESHSERRQKDLYRDYTSTSLCKLALLGSRPKWAINLSYNGYVEEAKRRGLSEQQCARLSGRFTEAQIANASPTLNQPINREKILKIQRLLISRGYLKSQADGIVGNLTTLAIKAFQKSLNSEQNGRISDVLVASLESAESDVQRTSISVVNVSVSTVLLAVRKFGLGGKVTGNEYTRDLTIDGTKQQIESFKDLVSRLEKAVVRRREKAEKNSQLAGQVKVKDERIAALEAKLAKLERENATQTARAVGPIDSAIAMNINYGDYHALVIGIDDYRSLPKLRTAIADARAVADVLRTRYRFEVTSLINPTRAQIVDKLDDLRATLTPTDNLLIYYAGHGWLDDKADQGFWLPVDADEKRTSNWLANDKITGTLKAIEAKHVMVIADSCYSGKLVRGVELALASPQKAKYLRQMARKKTRMAMSSGGLKPVEDGRGKHSPFARAFLKALNDNEKVMDGTSLFKAVREPVMLAADQTPEYSPIRRADHDGGDFLFVRRN